MKFFTNSVLLMVFGATSVLAQQGVAQNDQKLNAAEFEQAKQDALAEWKKLPIAEKQRSLARISNLMQFFRLPTDFDLFGNSPFNGVGISVQLRQERTNPDGDALGAPKKYVVVIGDVWEGSPAMRAGIQRGEQLVSINGEAVCSVTYPTGTSADTDDGDELRSCIEATYRKVQGLAGTVTLGIVRQVQLQEIVLDVSEVARQQSAEYEKAFHGVFDEVMAKFAPLKQDWENILRDIKEARDNEEKLETCFGSVFSFSVQFVQLMEEIDPFFKKEENKLHKTMQRVRE